MIRVGVPACLFPNFAHYFPRLPRIKLKKEIVLYLYKGSGRLKRNDRKQLGKLCFNLLLMGCLSELVGISLLERTQLRRKFGKNSPKGEVQTSSQSLDALNAGSSIAKLAAGQKVDLFWKRGERVKLTDTF